MDKAKYTLYWMPWTNAPTTPGCLRHARKSWICSKISFLYDIQTALEHLTSHRVSLHEEGGQRQDIIDYLKSVVESDPKMGKWREEDKQLVIDTLARKADGM